MTQPKFVPIQAEDQVRESYRLEAPRPWIADRPSDYRPGVVPRGRGFGSQGPDQGYALHLARHFEERLQLSDGESPEDAAAAAVGIALRRASLFGRAPSAPDLELGFTLIGYLGEPPAELVEWRTSTLSGFAHNQRDEREVLDQIPESTLRLGAAAVREQLGSWRQLLGVGG